MVNTRRSRFAGWLLSLVVSIGVGLVIVRFAHWFDRLRPTTLFLVVFGAVAVILYGAEWFHRREYSRDYVSQSHLDGLKETSEAIVKCVNDFKSISTVNGKDCRDLFSHRRDIERAYEKWDKAVSDWSQARWAYDRKLSALFAANEFQEPRFNRMPMLQNIQFATRNREMSAQRLLEPRQPMQWIWDVSPTDLDSDLWHDLLLRTGNGLLFIRDIHNTEDPIDVLDCEQRLVALFDEADSCAELVDWVKTELALEQYEGFSNFKELLHDFGRLDHLRHGRGCPQCNS